MLTVEEKNGRKNEIKVHCKTCPKRLESFVEGLQAMTDEDILLYTGYAEMHLNHHPQHDVTVYITKKVLPIVSDMQDLLDSVR